MATLLYSGNLGMGQDVGTVLRAVAALESETIPKVLIAGSGKGLPEVRELVSQLGLIDAEIRPPVPLYQLAGLLADGDIHIICQKPGTEGLLVPSKIYSTLAAGRPSIFIGPRDCEVGRIIQDSHSGFVVEPGNVEQAKEALRCLVTSRTLRQRMGRHARAYYESHFGRERSVSRIVGILQAAGNAGDGQGKAPRNCVPSQARAGIMVGMNDSIGQRRMVMERIKTIFDPRRLAAAVAGMLVVLGLTHIPQEMMPKRLQVHMLDKLEHVLAYGLVAFLFLLSFRKPPGLKAMTIILLAGALLGAADEMTQPLVNRIASSIDLAADVIGIALACALFLVMGLRRRARTLRSVTQA